MKVLLFNGSSNQKGCTYTALTEIAATLIQEGIGTEILQIGAQPIRDCIGCGQCAGKNACIFKDDVVNEWIQKAAEADGFIFGTPVYYAHPSGRLLTFMDRVFYSNGSVFRQKPAACVVSARRSGTTASMDVINKYFTISSMPVVASNYWNAVHGNTPEEVSQDKEGLMTVYNIGKNMAWLLQCIEAGKEKGVNPPENIKIGTNFIR